MQLTVSSNIVTGIVNTTGSYIRVIVAMGVIKDQNSNKATNESLMPHAKIVVKSMVTQ